MDTEKLAEIRARDAQTKKNQQDEQRHQELISNFDALGRSYMSAMKILVDFLTGTTTKTEVTNQLESISTPDVDKVVTAVGELKKSFDEKNVDLSPVVDVLSETNKYLQKLPTEFPEAKEVESVDLSPVNEILERIETAISSLNLVAEAPVINVPKAPTPNVHVDAPDMSILLKPLESLRSAFKELKMPDYEATDVSGLQKQLEKANEHLAKLVKKPVGGGGGGGGGYVFKMPNDGPMVAPELTASGNLPVEVIPSTDKTEIDKATTNIVYIGKALPGTLSSALAWTITKIDKTVANNITITHTGTTAVWDDRATEDYS